MKFEAPLADLTTPSEEELAKIILSSGDRFPGLYRISSSFKQALEEDIYMKWIDFFQVAFLTKTKNRTWSRSEWLKAQSRIFTLAFGKNSRNEERAEEDVKKIMRESYHQWFSSANRLRLAVIDTSSPVEDIECGKTYYLMGSLLRFEKESLLVGWDEVAKKAYCNLRVSFDDLQKYIHSIFTPQDITDLFIRSEVVSHLVFNENSESAKGELIFELDAVEKSFQEFNPKGLIFASVIHDLDLPVQYSKPMGVSNVLL